MCALNGGVFNVVGGLRTRARGEQLLACFRYSSVNTFSLGSAKRATAAAAAAAAAVVALEITSRRHFANRALHSAAQRRVQLGSVIIITSAHAHAQAGLM